METEAQRFEGWSRDDRTARTYAPIKYRRPVKLLFFVPFWLLIGTGLLKHFAGLVLPGLWIAACLASIGLALILTCAIHAAHRKAPTCPQCGRAMKLTATRPSPRDCETHNYMLGPSGHAYHRTARSVCEVRKHWYICTPCKNYVFLDLVEEPIGLFPGAMEQRESDYQRQAQQTLEIAKMLKATK